MRKRKISWIVLVSGLIGLALVCRAVAEDEEPTPSGVGSHVPKDEENNPDKEMRGGTSYKIEGRITGEPAEGTCEAKVKVKEYDLHSYNDLHGWVQWIGTSKDSEGNTEEKSLITTWNVEVSKGKKLVREMITMKDDALKCPPAIKDSVSAVWVLAIWTKDREPKKWQLAKFVPK